MYNDLLVLDWGGTVSMVVLFFLLAGVPNRTETIHLLTTAKATLEKGYCLTDIELLKRAESAFDRFAQESQDPRGLYYLGLVNYRILNCLNMQGKQEFSEQAPYLEKAISSLEQIKDGNPLYLEACALLHNLYGRKIALKPMHSLSLLPKMKKVAAQARSLDANNPRWLLMEAVYEYHAPKRFGGDREKALLGFAKAAQILAKNGQSLDGSPDWGLEDAYAWLGICYNDSGQTERARSYYDQALKINPEFGWIKKYLYPRLISDSSYSSHSSR